MVNSFVNFSNFSQMQPCSNMTTLALGEEGGDGIVTTMALGEEGGDWGPEPVKDGIAEVFDGQSGLDKNGDKVLDNKISLEYRSDIWTILPQNHEMHRGTQGVLFENLYNKTGSYRKDYVTTVDNYEMNGLGKYIAGEDGKITENEIKAIDTDKDGEVSQAEMDAKKAKMEQTPKPKPTLPESIIQLITLLLQLLMGKFGGMFNR